MSVQLTHASSLRRAASKPFLKVFCPMKSLIGSLIGLILSVSICTASETKHSPQELKAAKAQLRVHNRLWTFEEGAILGREWTSRAPEDAELRALYARQLHGQLDGHREIQEQADAILAREPDNPWGPLRASTRVSGGQGVFRGGRIQPTRLDAAASAGVCRDVP